MGWTVLYIAFGIVALWLLGEVLLQYKARLRWRLLAFAGFTGVVLGVLIPSVPVIAVGAIAFATGQTYVTLSFRRGFSTGWAIGGSPGASRRRRGGAPEQEQGDRDPSLEVTGLEYQQPAPETQAFAVYEPQPLPDETGQYGVYTGATYGGEDREQEHRSEPQPQYGAQQPFADHGQPHQAPYAAPYDQDPFGQNQQPQTHSAPYDYGADRQQYAAYSDPYIGTGTTNGPAQPGAYDSYGEQRYQDPYAGQYAAETPPGGVWVPQQRERDQYPPMPSEQPVPPAPYGNGNGDSNGNGYDTGQSELYRY